jgi:uncharacterized membrane protein YheB (UPF0754 family)
MWLDMAIMSVVGGAIGWFTNFLAIKLMFRPFTPIKVPLLNLKIQGLIPKRRRELAASIGKTVEENLISIEELLDRLIEGESKQELINQIKLKILEMIDARIPYLIPGGIRTAILKIISEILDHETESFIDSMAEDVIHKAARNLNVRKMVEEKINSFDLAQIERMIYEISSRELKAIEYLGGILGFIIGLIQAILISFI